MPSDELTIAALKQLGFTDLRIMQPFGRHVLNDVEIFPISSPSESFMECAALFRSPSGSIFNQVDTPLDEARLSHLEQLGRIDVMLAMYACQEFGWFVGRESDPSVAFEHNLRTLQRLNPRHVIPAAAGFRFVDHCSTSITCCFQFPLSPSLKPWLDEHRSLLAWMCFRATDWSWITGH